LVADGFYFIPLLLTVQLSMTSELQEQTTDHYNIICLYHHQSSITAINCDGPTQNHQPSTKLNMIWR